MSQADQASRFILTVNLRGGGGGRLLLVTYLMDCILHHEYASPLGALSL